ncbi:hypothetical protein U1Q18_044758 [Sarracenia purpurea var. burkii]
MSRTNGNGADCAKKEHGSNAILDAIAHRIGFCRTASSMLFWRIRWDGHARGREEANSTKLYSESAHKSPWTINFDGPPESLDDQL